jgi:hypothetical protein
VFLTGLSKEQNLFIYASAIRMLGVTLDGADSGDEQKKKPQEISTATTNQLIGFRGDRGDPKNLIAVTLSTLRAEANVATGNASSNRAELFSGDGDVAAVSSYLLREPPKGEGEKAKEHLAKLFQEQEVGSQLPKAGCARAAMFELVDIALTIILSKSDSPPEDLVGEAGSLLKKGREENEGIGFVLGFAEETLIAIARDEDGGRKPGNETEDRLADFATASARVMVASLEVSGFVDSGEAPWGSEGDENGKPAEVEEDDEQSDAATTDTESSTE